MLAAPETSAPPQFPSAKCDQGTYEIRGHASLLPRWRRHCTPTALLQLPVASAHAGVSQTWREGTQLMCLLPFPHSPPPSGMGSMGSSLEQHSRLSLQLQVLLLLQWGQPTDSQLAPTLKSAPVPSRQLLPSRCHEQCSQHPSPTRGRCPSLSRAVNWLGWASCGWAHTCVP